jgi:hypothetical protein
MESTDYICIRCHIDNLSISNPTMEEELYCTICMKENKMNLANFLIHGKISLNLGQPGCLECYKTTESQGNEIHRYHTYTNSMKKRSMNLVINTSNDIEENLLNLSRNSMENEDQIERHRRANTKFQLSDNLIFDRSDSEIAAKSNHKTLDNKFISLFSPKASVNMRFSTKAKATHNFDRLCSSLEVILKNTHNISINLPIVYEANKNEKKMLDSVTISALENGNFLFIFLDDRSELLFGLLINSVGDKNYFKFFKKIKNKIEYSDTFDSLVFDIEKNIIKHSNFSFNLTSYLFACNSMKLMSFLCYKKDKLNVMLYNNISYIKIYDMC